MRSPLLMEFDSVTKWLPVVIFAVIVFTIINFVVRFLRRRNDPLFPSRNSRAVVFEERWRSGWSHRSRLGKASNCLRITVTNDELWIAPHFPFSVLARELNLEHRIRKQDIVNITRAGKITTIEFKNGDGTPEKVDVCLRDPDGFTAALTPQTPK